MRFVEILVLLGVLGFAVYLVLSGTMRRREAASRWRVVTHTGEDGALRVVVRAPDGGERVVKELPAGLEGPELTAELRLAREEAFLQAEELNRPQGG
jgi:hypothetical protein